MNQNHPRLWLVVVIIFLLTGSSPAHMPVGTRDCPKFHVECFPAVDYSRPVLACMVYPSGLRPGQELTYSWSLSNAAIASGQGTYRITVDLTNPEAETMTANLKIGKLGPNCESTASFTLPLKELIKPKTGD